MRLGLRSAARPPTLRAMTRPRRHMLQCNIARPRSPGRARTAAGHGLVVALALTALVGPAALASETLGVPLRFGVAGGYQVTSSDFDVMGTRRAALRPGSAGFVGLRFAWHALDLLELELTGGLMPAGTATPGADALLLPVHLDLVVRPFAGAVVPYLALGGGAMALVAGEAGRDTDTLLHTALGIEVDIDHSVAVRAEAGLYATDAVDRAMSFNPIFTLGVDILAWRPFRDREEPPPPIWVAPPTPTPPAVTETDDDMDADGVVDADDRCPRHAGSRDANGCPDTDRDGTLDPFDRCPLLAGPTSLIGCPDADGDGATDRDDACPETAGAAERYGCPLTPNR